MCLLKSMSTAVFLPLVGTLIRVSKWKHRDFSLRIERFECLNDVLGTWTEIQDSVMRHTLSLLSRFFFITFVKLKCLGHEEIHSNIKMCCFKYVWMLWTSLVANGIISAGTNGWSALGILKLTFSLISQMTYIPESTFCCPTERTQVSYLISMS